MLTNSTLNKDACEPIIFTVTSRHKKTIVDEELITNDDYCSEVKRLDSFNNWPLDFIDKFVLAQTGMFYTSRADIVKCYFCEVEIGKWEKIDHPVSEHIKLSSNCPLLRRKFTNNIPIDYDSLDRILPPPMDYLPETKMCPMAYPEGSISEQEENINELSHPYYAIENKRYQSFFNWPPTIKQTPYELAEAGFFYSGYKDGVKCFSCGGGLMDWNEKDKPWEQHALWLSKCKFVQKIKGQQFIDTILNKHKRMISSKSGSSNMPPANYSSTLQDKLCKICYLNNYNTAFLPCGHVVACTKCATSVSKCPLCRKQFQAIVRVYFS